MGLRQKAGGMARTTFAYLERDQTKQGTFSAAFGALFAYFTVAGESIRETVNDPATKILFTGVTMAMAGCAIFYSAYAVHNWQKSWSTFKGIIRHSDPVMQTA